MPILRWLNEHFNLFSNIRILPVMVNMEKGVKFTDVINEKSDVEDLKLILSQAEERNKSLNANADSLYQKTIIFLGISLPALTSLIIYLSRETPTLTPQYFICYPIAICLIVACKTLKQNLKMEEYFGVGTNPADLVHIDFYTDLNGKEPEWYIMQRLIKDIYIKIEHNDALNGVRVRVIKKAIDWLYYIPGLCVLTILVFWILPRLW